MVFSFLFRNDLAKAESGCLRGASAPLSSSPPHSSNIYPYHGEGDKGGEVDIQYMKRLDLGWAECYIRCDSRENISGG